jgi:hypothetical protein
MLSELFDALEKRIPDQVPAPVMVEVTDGVFKLASEPLPARINVPSIPIAHDCVRETVEDVRAALTPDDGPLYQLVGHYAAALGETVDQLQVRRLGYIGVCLEHEIAASQSKLTMPKRALLSVLVCHHKLFVNQFDEWKVLAWGDRAGKLPVLKEVLYNVVAVLLIRFMRKRPKRFDTALPEMMAIVQRGSALLSKNPALGLYQGG